jgi:hypothetical protein
MLHKLCFLTPNFLSLSFATILNQWANFDVSLFLNQNNGHNWRLQLRGSLIRFISAAFAFNVSQQSVTAFFCKMPQIALAHDIPSQINKLHLFLTYSVCVQMTQKVMAKSISKNCWVLLKCHSFNFTALYTKQIAQC